MKIPFHKPFISDKEIKYLNDIVSSRDISDRGKYTHKCLNYFKKTLNTNNIFLTCNATSALEIIILLLNPKPGDEIILPSFTYVSTANVLYKNGIKPVFADCQTDHPNIDMEDIKRKITKRTIAIMPMHYGGMSCNMDEINDIAHENNLYVIEDAALGFGSYYKDIPLGTIGDFGFYSFHYTKHITSGEGGLLIINNPDFIERAQIIYENGTNRIDFLNNKVDKYEWTDIGISCKMSEINAAFLFAQLENSGKIKAKHKEINELYYHNLLKFEENNNIIIIKPDKNCNFNYNLFALATKAIDDREKLQKFLSLHGVETSFHYQSLHNSKFFSKFNSLQLFNSEYFSNAILRLPIYYDLEINKVLYIFELINKFFEEQSNQ